MSQQPGPQTHARIGFTNIADFVFNIATLLAMDFSKYEQGKEGRTAKLVLVGPYEHSFTDKDADQVFLWYLEISGQARIQPGLVPVPPLRA